VLYQLTSPDSSRRYVGRVGKIETTFKEHVAALRNNNNYSKFAQKALNNGHTVGSIDMLSGSTEQTEANIWKRLGNTAFTERRKSRFRLMIKTPSRK
jgi:hypothetical protein